MLNPGLFFEAFSDPFCVLNSELLLENVNQAFIATFGEVHLGSPFLLYVAEREREDIAKALKGCRERAVDFTCNSQTKDHGIKHFYWKVNRHQSDFFLIAHEILTSKHHTLLTDEDFYSFVDNSPAFLVCMDSEGKILWASKSEMEFLGYETDEYIGRNMRE